MDADDDPRRDPRRVEDPQMEASDPTMKRTEMLVTGGDVRELGEPPAEGSSGHGEDVPAPE